MLDRTNIGISPPYNPQIIDPNFAPDVSYTVGNYEPALNPNIGIIPDPGINIIPDPNINLGGGDIIINPPGGEIIYEDPNYGIPVPPPIIPDYGGLGGNVIINPVPGPGSIIPDQGPIILPPGSGVTGSFLPDPSSQEYVARDPLADEFGTYDSTGGNPFIINDPIPVPQPIPPPIPPPIPQPAPVPLVVPSSQTPTAPIFDEDFTRGRPIYDEFQEDRYRGFRLGR